MDRETAFSIDTSSIKFRTWGNLGGRPRDAAAGRGPRHGRDRPNLARSDPVLKTLSALEAEGIDAVPFDGVRIEPTDVSFKEAIDFASGGGFDGYVAVGGGSCIDTAKAANLYATHPQTSSPM